jgi:signal transduction histidine kinase
MVVHTRLFRRRVGVLVTLLILAVLACISLAVLNTSSTLRRLEDVEIEAVSLARQFRAEVDGLHSVLLRTNRDTPSGSKALVQQRRRQLDDWMRTRMAGVESDEERQILLKLDAAMRSYFARLDELTARTNGLSLPLDRASIIECDDDATLLQSMADDYAAVHDKRLRSLLQASLRSMLRMRNLVFVCLALLVAAIGVVVALIYRDVVRPLRQQLVDSKSLLAKREKLAALGTLAAGVAHEIRNPLTAIKARLYTLRAVPTSGSATEDILAITDEVDRLERIVRDVLGYAQPAKPAFGRVELSAWLREFAEFVRPDITGNKIELLVNAATTADVYVDSNQLRQIMLNLVRNAKEALAGRGGQIALSLHRDRVPLRGKMADVAVLAVADNGPGISEEIQSRLFDPFFTTKAAGTGLGLSIVARLVEYQGGEIKFQSSPLVGTRFAVHLPCGDVPPQTDGK